MRAAKKKSATKSLKSHREIVNKSVNQERIWKRILADEAKEMSNAQFRRWALRKLSILVVLVLAQSNR